MTHSLLIFNLADLAIVRGILSYAGSHVRTCALLEDASTYRAIVIALPD